LSNHDDAAQETMAFLTARLDLGNNDALQKFKLNAENDRTWRVSRETNNINYIPFDKLQLTEEKLSTRKHAKVKNNELAMWSSRRQEHGVVSCGPLSQGDLNVANARSACQLHDRVTAKHMHVLA
jgi:hypothetical protein